MPLNGTLAGCFCVAALVASACRDVDRTWLTSLAELQPGELNGADAGGALRAASDLDAAPSPSASALDTRGDAMPPAEADAGSPVTLTFPSAAPLDAGAGSADAGDLGDGGLPLAVDGCASVSEPHCQDLGQGDAERDAAVQAFSAGLLLDVAGDCSISGLIPTEVFSRIAWVNRLRDHLLTLLDCPEASLGPAGEPLTLADLVGLDAELRPPQEELEPLVHAYVQRARALFGGGDCAAEALRQRLSAELMRYEAGPVTQSIVTCSEE